MEGLNYDQICADILEQINKARASPEDFMVKVQERLNSYDGKNFTVDDQVYQSFEGEEAPKEAIAALQITQPKEQLERCAGLDQAAADLASYLGETGEVSHTGKDGTRMGDRISAHGKWTGKIGEIIGVQPESGLNFVLQWIIDDGVKTRGDRKSILSPDFTRVGVAACAHKTYKTVAVVVFSEAFAGEGETLPEPEVKENPDLIKSLPDGLNELPDDAKGMTVKKNMTQIDGQWTTKFIITYQLNDGGERVLEKEYPGKK